MIIILEKLKQSSEKALTLEEEINITDLKIDGVEFYPNAKLKVKAELLEDEVMVKGKVEAEAKIQCVRCLEKFNKKFNLKFETLFYEEKKYEKYEEEKSEEIYYSHEEVIREPFKNGKIDIDALAKEYLTMEAQNFFVCSEECKGLEKMEEYDNNGIDPRWQQLIDIIKENR